MECKLRKLIKRRALVSFAFIQWANDHRMLIFSNHLLRFLEQGLASCRPFHSYIHEYKFSYIHEYNMVGPHLAHTHLCIHIRQSVECYLCGQLWLARILMPFTQSCETKRISESLSLAYNQVCNLQILSTSYGWYIWLRFCMSIILGCHIAKTIFMAADACALSKFSVLRNPGCFADS